MGKVIVAVTTPLPFFLNMETSVLMIHQGQVMSHQRDSR